MNEIHDSKLSSKENKELEEFALNHPYTKVVELIQNTVTKLVMIHLFSEYYHRFVVFPHLKWFYFLSFSHRALGEKTLAEKVGMKGNKNRKNLIENAIYVNLEADFS